MSFKEQKNVQISRIQSAAIRMAGLALILSLFSSDARSQSDWYLTNSNLRGVVPFGTYQFDEIDNVNLGNGALNVRLPLFTRRGRGLDDGRSVFYSSKLWVIQPSYNPITQQVVAYWYPSVSRGAGRFDLAAHNGGSIDYKEEFYPCEVSSPGGPFPSRIRSNFVYTSEGGGTHRFPNRDVFVDGPPGVVCENFDTTDYNVGDSDSGVMELDTSQEPYVVRSKNGVRQLLYGAIVDTNGNFIDGNGDTLKRVYPFENQVLSMQDSDGGSATFTFVVTNVSVSSQFPSTECGPNLSFSQFNNPIPLVSSLTMPNGRAYLFSYASSGELIRIDLPSGGYLRYEYVTKPLFDNGMQGAGCGLDSRRVWKRHVSADGAIESEKTWEYEYERDPSTAEYTTTVTDPSGNVAVHKFMWDGIHQLESTISGLRKVVNTWSADLGPVQSNQDGSIDLDHRDHRITISQVTLLDVVPNQVSRTETVYDGYSEGGYNKSRVNVVESREYDYSGELKRKTTFAYLHDENILYKHRHVLDRATRRTIYQGESDKKTETLFKYDTTPIEATSGVIQHDYTNYGSGFSIRGNLTEIHNWLDTTPAWLVTTNWYDDLGNVVRTQDPGLHSTYFSYIDSWAVSPCQPHEGQAQGAAFLTRTTNALNQFTQSSYYPCTSLTASTTDANNRTSLYSYDRMDRIKRINFPDAGVRDYYYSDIDLSAVHRGVVTVFPNGVTLPLRSRVYTRIQSSPSILEKVEATVLDKLGRVSMVGTSNASYTDWTRTEYDGKGRVWRVSNPISLSGTPDVPNATSFNVWTTTTYDGLDRVTQVQAQDNQLLTTSYDGDTATVTDQALNKRFSQVDALGRLVKVREPNELTGSLESGYHDTSYTYDVVDNLVGVIQGEQTRTFLYDSIGRLKQETNPESGLTRYEYDSDSNLIWKEDARLVRINYNNHDVLHRVGNIAYTDSTPTLTFGYDSDLSSNSKGRITSRAENGLGTETYQYDTMGRISQLKRTFDGEYTLTGDYTYNLIGGVIEIANPETWTPPFKTKYTNDNAGRQITYQMDFGAPPVNVVNNYTFVYGANTQETTTFANGTEETVIYNGRLQPVSRVVYNTNITPPEKLMDFSYSFDPVGQSKNNGNVYSINDNVISGKNQTFTYDYLNRIKTAMSSDWSMIFHYDRYGNRHTQTGTGTAPSKNLSFDPLTNRVIGYGYDSAGNLTQDLAHTYQYDAENRIKTVDLGNTAIYAYDGRGNRVKRAIASETRYYFFDAMGKPFTERLAGIWFVTSNMFLNGKQVAIDGLRYIHSDHRGTPRIIVDPNAYVQTRDWYYPFGEQISIPANSFKYRFTGKERDSESGLDYFGARHYANSLARFVSVDPKASDRNTFENPQRLNRYSYTLNNPLRYVDSDGQEPKNAGWYERVRAYLSSYFDSKNSVRDENTTVTLPTRLGFNGTR